MIYRSPPVDAFDNSPKYKSYQEHFERVTNMYYCLWVHRTNVTVNHLRFILGIPAEGAIKPAKEEMLSPYSVDWECAMSALRQHGVDVEYDGSRRLRVIGEE